MGKEKKNKEEKQPKKGKKIIIIIAIILLLTALGTGGFLMWKELSKKEEPKKVVKKEKIKTTDKLKLIEYTGEGEEYIVRGDYILNVQDNELYAILSYEGQEIIKLDTPLTYSEIYLSNDNGLYIEDLMSSDDNSENALDLYYFNGEKIEDYYKSTEDNVVIKPIVQYYYKDNKIDNEQYTLLGYNLLDNENKENNIYNVKNKKKAKYGSCLIKGSTPYDSSLNYQVSFDGKYITCQENEKMGVLEISNGKEIIEPTYDSLYQDPQGTFIATKDKKSGIIDIKLKKKVDYTYDFIYPFQGGYLVNQNNKLAIMDANYQLVIDYSFDYQKSTTKETTFKPEITKDSENTFKISKHNQKYFLAINNINDSVTSQDEFTKKEAYIIDENGEIKTIVETAIYTEDIIYSYNSPTQEITVYDDKLEELYKISLKDYDIKNEDISISKYGQAIAVSVGGQKIFFDFKTGEELEENIYSYELNNIKVTIDEDSEEITFYDDNQENKDLSGNIINGLQYKELENGTFFINDKERLIVVTNS